MKKFFIQFGDAVAIVLLCLTLILSVIGCFKKCTDEMTEVITSPVEERIIDSLHKDNSKLVIEVKHLDSLKHVETIEVKNLNNDSTLGLFYKLIRN